MHKRWRAFIVGLIALAGLALLFVLTHDQSVPAPTELAAATLQDTAAAPAAAAAPLVGADRGPQQPIAYSHRVHAGQYEMQCLYCHTNADRSQFVPIPAVATCMGCHRVVLAGSEEIQKLRGYEQRGEPVPWVRIHKLADFVQFPHMRHVAAGLECQECHGPIEEMDVVYQFSTLTMGWCLACHWQPADADKVAVAEANAVRFQQDGRESRFSLYPRSIDSQYGMNRGPIDCVACHY